MKPCVELSYSLCVKLIRQKTSFSQRRERRREECWCCVVKLSPESSERKDGEVRGGWVFEDNTAFVFGPCETYCILVMYKTVISSLNISTKRSLSIYFVFPFLGLLRQVNTFY